MSLVKMKDPGDDIDYTIDWEADDWLADSETISTSTWTVEPTGSLTIGTTSSTASTTTAFVSAGDAGTVYRLTNEITTNQNRTAQRSVSVRVEER